MRRSRFFLSMLGLPAILLVLVSSSDAQIFTDILDFTGGSFGDPGVVTLAQARNGDLYGSTFSQPLTGLGTLFGITTEGKVVMEYTGFDYTNGYFPDGGMTLGTDGNLYGTTEASLGESGVIYKITTSGTYTALQQFNGGNGGQPIAPPIEGTDGNFYGVTNGYFHGQPSGVYQYAPQTGIITSLRQFGKEIGLYYPLTQGVDGDLYGAALSGGPSNLGAIFRVSTSGILRFVYNFPGGAGGENPNGPLVQLSDGNFYGTASGGGTGGVGIVFKMTPAGAVSILYDFDLGSDTHSPITGLALGTDGQLYGASSGGGAFDAGTIYRISPTGQYTLLYSFPSFAFPSASLVQHTNGRFYGVTSNGGANNFGMVYSLDVGLGPFITLVQPQGQVGQDAEILGQGLNGATSVTFNGVPTTRIRVLNGTYLTAVVPSGATTGKVVVTTPSGTLTSNVSFRIIN